MYVKDKLKSGDEGYSQYFSDTLNSMINKTAKETNTEIFLKGIGAGTIGGVSGGTAGYYGGKEIGKRYAKKVLPKSNFITKKIVKSLGKKITRGASLGGGIIGAGAGAIGAGLVYGGSKYLDKRRRTKTAGVMSNVKRYAMPGLAGALGIGVPAGIGMYKDPNNMKSKNRLRNSLIAGGIGAAFGGTMMANAHRPLKFHGQRKSYSGRGYKSTGAKAGPTKAHMDNTFGKKIYKDFGNVKTKNEAKSIYRNYARKTHPDKGGKATDFDSVTNVWQGFRKSKRFNKLAYPYHLLPLTKEAGLTSELIGGAAWGPKYKKYSLVTGLAGMLTPIKKKHMKKQDTRGGTNLLPGVGAYRLGRRLRYKLTKNKDS